MTRTVACVLNVGEFRKRTYSPEWAQRLRRMVARHLGPHRFVCFSNVPIEGVNVIWLTKGWPGWWAKLEMFRRGVLEGRVLYLDLDVVVVDRLEPLFEVKGDFVAMKADYDGPTRMKEGKRITAGLNSGTMAWDADGRATALYDEFYPWAMNELRGDQDWITEQMDEPAFFPKGWFARLRDCHRGPPPGVRIVHCMPEKNDVAVQKFPWVKQAWG